MRISPVFVMLAVLGVSATAAEAQARNGSWSPRISWSASAVSLGAPRYREWRPAMAVGVELDVKGHFDLEAAATTPLSTRRATTCADAGPVCTGDPGQPEFTILTASVGVHTNVGRFRPFVGLGRGRISVRDIINGATIHRGGIWLFRAGVDMSVVGALSAGLSYRGSRVRWRSMGVGVNHEVELRLSVGFLGTP